MSTLIEAVAALPGWQRARVNRVRVDGDGRAVVTWLGMVPLADPTVHLDGPVPDGVELRGWELPDDTVVCEGVMDPESELGVLAESGVLGDCTVDRLTAPDEVRWVLQAWDSRARAVVAGGLDVSAALMMTLAADADLRLARYRLRAAEVVLQGRVRSALAEGEPAPRVAAAVGLSRARVYQLRDGVR